MKYLLAGDFHGRSIEPLRGLEFDVLISTGDFDHPDVIREFIELKHDLEARDKEIYIVPGNHDDAVFRGQNISSGTLREQKTTVPELHKKLQNSPEEEQFLQNILDEQIADLNVNDMKTVVVHGGLGGSMISYPNCPSERKIFWRRLRSKENHRDNFNQMESQGYQLMVRGHDHKPEYAYRHNSSIETLAPNTSTKYSLEKERHHTVTHGPWFDGWYATIETASSIPVLEFHNLD